MEYIDLFWISHSPEVELKYDHRNPSTRSFKDRTRKAVETITEKWENAGNPRFLYFPKCFLLFKKWVSIGFGRWNLSSANALNLDKSRSLFNFFSKKPWFLRVCSTRLLKTLLEKEKLLVTSNFSFSHSVFFQRTFRHFHKT